MLKKLWRKVAGKTAAPAAKTVLPYAEHGIDGADLSYAAEQVVNRLQKAGYQAYVVGGAVRDLLLGREPKDFDVATDATPEEVRALFRRSRIIGRRFQIVHVMVGPETIEVTTFRGGGKAVQNAHGRIMKDNHYGSMEEDAQRRDFTCNALYYDPKTREITDFHHGADDIRARRLVMIGDPAERYQEDPVRILRAVRLSAKLGFEVEAQTREPIGRFAGRLKEEPAARLFDEIMKLLFSGYSRACLAQLSHLGVSEGIHPLFDALQVRRAGQQDMVAVALKNTDERLRQDKSVSVGFVLAALLWQPLEQMWRQQRERGEKAVPALNTAIARLREQIEKGWGVPQKFAATMREIWVLQPQFENRKGARPYRLLAQPRFRAAYDFLVLRAQLGEVPQELADWWTAFQHADDTVRAEMTAAAPQTEEASPRRKRRRKPRRRSAQKNGGQEAAV
ncbi:polynucleotide adenylyltransferase PcnB [Neisseria leonii]|uniref:polynucleotide adenylyltransferase PcnB n=1 Tax=Neisseria leonii TaxID=2995413 RepID=UPI00237BB182|nr:polynucleotide adenylyltransferase PcnB [Neisseria sp. 3986]MDD9324899.1 polynucleotide adenylyltransferase PcnB [Neisseria sp. 3986]